MKEVLKMTPLRPDPLRELANLQDQLARLSGSLGWSDGRSTWLPAVDVFDSRDAIVLKADLAGVRPEDLDLRLEENVLTLRGERRPDAGPEEERFYRVERPVGRFERVVTLPRAIRGEECEARFDMGVLTVRIPKSQEKRPRRVPIEIKGGRRDEIDAAKAA
jgi:HSP20 family protein